MKLYKNKLSYIFLLLICMGMAAENTSEEASSASESVRQVCVFSASDISEAAGLADESLYREFLDANLILELKNAGFGIIDDFLWKAQQQAKGYSDLDLLDGAKAIEVAAAVGADVAIKQFFYIEEDKITFGIKCYDVKAKLLSVHNLKQESAGLVIVSSINKFISEMVPVIKEKMQPFSGVGEAIIDEQVIEETVQTWEYIPKGETVNLSLKSPDNGAGIILAGTPIGRIEEQQLLLKAQVNSTLMLDITSEGFHPEHKMVTIGEQDLEYGLPPLMKKTRWGMALEYSVFQFLGAGIGFRYYFEPDTWGIAFTNYPYFQVINAENRNTVLHNDSNICLFIYPFIKPSAFFRFNLFLGSGAITTVIFREGIPAYFDFYVDVGAAAELNFPHFILYYRQYGRYVFNIPQVSLLETGQSPPIGVQFTFGVLLKW